MITENEIDERAAAWLIQKYGIEAVERAKMQLAGARKPYPSNIAKILGVRLPESLKIVDRETAQANIAELKKIISGKKENKTQ